MKQLFRLSSLSATQSNIKEKLRGIAIDVISFLCDIGQETVITFNHKQKQHDIANETFNNITYFKELAESSIGVPPKIKEMY